MRTTARITSTAMILAGMMLGGCGRQVTEQPTDEGAEEAEAVREMTAEELAREAKRLVDASIVVDTHIDVPYRMLEKEEDISGTTEGDFDHPKAVAGGLNAAFMSIYVPASLQKEGGAFEHAEKLIDMVEGFPAEWPDKFAIAVSPADVRAQAERPGLVSLPLGMENGAPIRTLEDLEHFHARGIRYITLTHGEDNEISDSSYADKRTWGGLSDFGKQVVAEMNRLGIMVDVSHVSDDSFWQALEASRAPMIASHSSCRHFTPGFERNMSDEMIQALAEKGGVVQINFGSSFLTPEANEYFGVAQKARREFVAAQPSEPDEKAMETWFEQYRREHPFPYADVADVADHIEHVVAIAGVDHVGLGSDFDGVGDSLPTGLKDASGYPNLVAELLRRGWSEQDLGKLLGENLLRVWEEVERAAAQS
ncbi:MAG: dipeptidase [Thermoanaerobaculia bacterium]